MHHYPFHIGDYRKDTGNLSLLEHGVYRTLLDCYYTQETPLPADKAKLCRMIGARTSEEVEAVSNVIDDYFRLTDIGYVQDGCDKVLSVIYEKSEKARVSAEKRWAKNNEKMLQACCGDANALEKDANASKNDATDMLPITHNPIPNSITSSGDDDRKGLAEKIDYQAIIELYHSMLPELPRVVNMTDKRRKAIRTCCNTKKSYYKLEFWEAYFNQVRRSDFLMGRAKDWRANIDFLTQHSSFVKVIEGGYT